jgi:hypothetical protein
MTPYLTYHYWRSILAAHQWLQCGQMAPFPPCCMIALMGALAKAMVRGN